MLILLMKRIFYVFLNFFFLVFFTRKEKSRTTTPTQHKIHIIACIYFKFSYFDCFFFFLLRVNNFLRIEMKMRKNIYIFSVF